MARISPEARKFLSRKIKKNLKEGKPFQQAVAISYSQVRAEGYKVPAYRKHTSALKRLS